MINTIECSKAGKNRFAENAPTGELLMKIFRAAALLALLTGPAYGQMPNINMMPSDTKKSRTPEEIEQDDAKDKAYRDSMRKIPDAKAASDPWGNVRGPDSRKTAAQPKPRAKSGAATGQ